MISLLPDKQLRDGNIKKYYLEHHSSNMSSIEREILLIRGGIIIFQFQERSKKWEREKSTCEEKELNILNLIILQFSIRFKIFFFINDEYRLMRAREKERDQLPIIIIILKYNWTFFVHFSFLLCLRERKRII